MARDWSSLTTADGSRTLLDPSGLACHAREGAWTEACERYAAGAELARLGAERGGVRLLDVGTGLGLNLAAARRALDGTPLVAVGLEVSDAVLRAALELAQPPEVERWYAPVRRALAASLARPGPAAMGGEDLLDLRLGDARDHVRAVPDASIDAVFLDPFALADAPDLWEGTFLDEVARTMAPGARLVTYSASLTVRARLAAAGLAVGALGKVGGKGQGTVAARGGPVPALEPRTQRKLTRRLARLGSEPPRD